LQSSAFTIIELLVVVAMIAILAALLLPARAKTKEKGQALRCLGNNKQLNLALAMYAGDNQGSLPPNGDDDMDGTHWFPGNQLFSFDAYNPALITSRSNVLGRYVGATASDVYRCPGDTRHGTMPGGDDVPLIRSFSLNLAVGTLAGSDVYPNGVPVYASALIGVSILNTPNNQPFNTFGKISDTLAPGPANVFTFMDEDQDSINYGSFIVTMFRTGSPVTSPFVSMNKPTQMMDWPCTAHGGVASVSFLDGHAELHKWLDGRTKNVQHKNGTLLGYTQSGVNTQPTVQTPDNPDILWLQSRTTAPK
jgi:prepilin-type N-terminal cleavage/methylation domain-containing protein/prepilin-type processing-associated H-X9-DG protein